MRSYSACRIQPGWFYPKLQHFSLILIFPTVPTETENYHQVSKMTKITTFQSHLNKWSRIIMIKSQQIIKNSKSWPKKRWAKLTPTSFKQQSNRCCYSNFAHANLSNISPCHYHSIISSIQNWLLMWIVRKKRRSRSIRILHYVNLDILTRWRRSNKLIRSRSIEALKGTANL